MINPDLSSPSFYQEYSEVGNTNTSNHLFAVDYNRRGSLVIGGASGYTRTIEDDARTVSNIFWYDELGRLVVSQNSKQFNYATPAYSYTQFDALGRITEVGEFESTSGPQDYMLVNNVDYIGISTLINGSTKRQVTQTWYDNDFAPMGAGITQVNLRKRVASITYEETFDGNNSTYDHATHYTYDIHGNVDLMVQDVPALAAYGSQFKKIRYEYDLVSGKVNSVHFNENELDQFHHRYTYDADNRITMVETSRDNINWDVDATYQYYLHGPLMRTEIGDLKVQGIDFAYTLHGWIKGVNAGILDPVRDMGKDGHVSVGNLNQYVARDAFGYILGYYSNPGSSVEDYISINSSGVNHFLPNTSGSDLMTFRNNLFNGNITSMQTALPNCSTYNASKTISNETFGNAYNYDQLNRIKSSRTFTNLNSITNAWGSTGMVSQNYSTDYTYDANGNILNLTRWGNGTQMDEFSYNYNVQSGKLQSNRLYHVNDNVALSSNYADDIDDQGTFNSTLSTINTANNYGYDELGNLIRDNAEDISSIEWNVQGKITKVNRNSGSTKPTLEFTYDAMGQRLSKKVTESSGNVKTFYYIRDAQGNEMSRYVHYTDGLGDEYFVSEEHSIYGSSRLGLQTRRDTLYKNTTITPNYDYVFRDLGTKQYELSNHLGNVLATITDQNKPVSGGGITIDNYEPVVVSISDYYPFGSLIPNRSWSDASRVYRYGFNGKEKDFETSSDNYDFGARIYDGRLGRWLSLDPLMKKYPNFSHYNFANLNPIIYMDVAGEDAVITVNNTGNNTGNTITVKSEIILYGPNAKDVDINALNAKMKSIGAPRTFKDENGKEWTITYDITFKYSQELTDYASGLDKNSKAYSDLELGDQNKLLPSETQKASGYEQGDNILRIDDSEYNGYEGGFAGQGVNAGRSKNIQSTIIHETFHMLGYGDRYAGALNGIVLIHAPFAHDVMGNERNASDPLFIHPIHYTDLIKTINPGSQPVGTTTTTYGYLNLAFDTNCNGTDISCVKSNEDLQKATDAEVKKQ